ncbi:hypothetical protein CK203_061867 [Vitis vinifera]|uniref:Retrovirus-related Pol polyprotein from transposon TNT 1-94-like beta-barrel domain-containing protein n=1 Tax=Vitis vinifera TaxID=29760 RepID=A0A438G6X8_VITVI|nr:hypothetical protein CK203_061867 [Vitis vinifera]
MLGKQTVAATTESSTLATRVSPATMEKISNEREDLGVTISRNMVMQRIHVGTSMSQQPKPPQPTSIISIGSVAQKGNFLSALNAKQKRTRPWIVDSGASDQTEDANAFDTYDPCSSNYFVCIADGSLSKVVGSSSVTVSKDLTLHSVLLVPNLDCNLLSISKLTKDLKCVTKFFPNHCEFQVMDSGMMIGNAKVHEGALPTSGQ